MQLTEEDRAKLDGTMGSATQTAMALLVEVAESMGADRLIDISSSHIDGCLYHGVAGLDFAEMLVAEGGQVAVPTTLNVTSLDLLHPEIYKGATEDRDNPRRLIDAYLELGCRPTWTCAPYQLPERPSLGEQIAWGESNAIVFANSVLGARTQRYGDFMDICCALAGRAPYAGLHTDRGRLATIVVDVHLDDEVLSSHLAYPLLGHALGRIAGNEVAALEGLPPSLTEDRLKAIGAAAASSGAVAMFHAVGITPEAPDLQSATGDLRPRQARIGLEDLRRAYHELATGTSGRLGAVSVGTPHMSLLEFEELVPLVEGQKTKVPFYVNTGRDVLEAATKAGYAAVVESFGARIVTDTCTYLQPMMEDFEGDVMTNSGKWAFYAPANLGVDVLLGSLKDCVKAATSGVPVSPEILAK